MCALWVQGEVRGRDVLEALLVPHHPWGEKGHSQAQKMWLNEESHTGLLHRIPGLRDAYLCELAPLGYGVW